MAELATEQLSQHELKVAEDPVIHVLHVDDDEDFLKKSKRKLEKWGSFEIEMVSTVTEALKKIDQKSYDVIVSDYQIPELNGLAFLKKLKEKRYHIPFILFTQTYREEIAIEALNSGAYRYFNKNEKEIVYVELAHSLKKAVKDKRAKKQICSLAKFPSEDPNPVLRVAKNGLILYSNKVAKKYKCHPENIAFVPEKLQQSVALSLRSDLTEEVEINCGDQTFSFVVAPIPEEGYANVYGRNISESKAAWNSLEETMNELVMINEKLGVVGRLTRHDARNKLSVILNNIYLAKKMVSKDKGVIAYLTAVESAVDQMEKIFDFARTYEMLGIEELSYSNINKNFDQAVMLFSDLEKIKIAIGCKKLSVLADSLLRQLFYNLIHNSLVHGKNVTRIQLYCKEENEQLKLIYEDNGVGISKDEKEKIFREGYGKGTGYGLYLIKKICEAYGWTIQEWGIPGKGALFVMTIPKTIEKGKQAYKFDND